MARNKFQYKNLFQKELNSPSLSFDDLIFTIWSVSFIGCFWYHNEIEKKIHFQYFMDKFVAAHNVTLKRKILNYVLDAIKTFGSPQT